MTSTFPILDAAQAGFVHLRENLRESLVPAAITAFPVAGLQYLAWTSPSWALLTLPIGAIAVVPFIAGQYRRALDLGPCALRLGGDEMRLAGAMAAVAFFFGIVAAIGLFLVLIAAAIGLMASGVDLSALPNDPQALQQALGPKGISVLLACATPLLVTIIWVGARLISMGPATLDQGRIMAFSTWSWTKGSALRIVAAQYALRVPLGIGVLVVQSAAGALLLGIGVKATALVASHPVQVFLFGLVMTFTKLILLEGPSAGQAAFLYRGFNPLAREAGANDAPR